MEQREGDRSQYFTERKCIRETLKFSFDVSCQQQTPRSDNTFPQSSCRKTFYIFSQGVYTPFLVALYWKPPSSRGQHRMPRMGKRKKTLVSSFSSFSSYTVVLLGLSFPTNNQERVLDLSPSPPTLKSTREMAQQL